MELTELYKIRSENIIKAAKAPKQEEMAKSGNKKKEKLWNYKIIKINIQLY